MKKIVLRSIVLAIILLIALFAGYLLFRNHPIEIIDIDMAGVKILPDGRVFDEGEIIIRGEVVTERGSAKYFVPTELNIMGLEFSSNNIRGEVHTYAEIEYTWLVIPVYDTTISSANILSVFIDKDFDWCIVQLGSRYQEFYFVGTKEHCQDYLSIISPFVG